MTDPIGWHPTACILGECNCGIEVRLGGDDGRRFERIRGEKAHPGSQGYTCEKALRLDYEELDWDTAIAEVAERLKAVGAEHGGETILYYGGGGQGNHLGGSYSAAMLRAFGAKYRSNALAQEKTGEFWVNNQLSLPDGLGLDHPEGESRVVTGVAPNELTASDDRDPWAGTPWHKSVPARVEARR